MTLQAAAGAMIRCGCMSPASLAMGHTNAIGLAGEADCVVKQRLSAVGQVNSIMRTNDNSANALNYDITWPASADARRCHGDIYPVRGKA